MKLVPEGGLSKKEVLVKCSSGLDASSFSKFSRAGEQVGVHLAALTPSAPILRVGQNVDLSPHHLL